MAKMTLLELTQEVLSSIDGDEITSITDTVESTQVALIVKQEYFDLLSSDTYPHKKTLGQLTELADTNKPVYFQLPEAVEHMYDFRYNTMDSGDTNPQYKVLEYLDSIDFLDRVMRRNLDNTNIVEITDDSGVKLLIQNDKQPDFWTSFDDEYIVCDSYDASVDTYMLASKTLCYFSKEPTWTHTDGATPDLSSNLFQRLLNKAKATAAIELRQSRNMSAESKVRNKKVMSQNDKYRTLGENNTVRTTNSGRRIRR